MTETHFGFSSIPSQEKAARVGEIFRNVAGRYDLMNDLMSAGQHRLWKRRFVDALRPRPGERILDLAGGTGDIARLISERIGPASPVLLTDINETMLREGRARAIDQNRMQGLRFACLNAEALPFPDRSVDAVTIAFGIRNVTDIPAALREAHRVLKPGGRFFCLEFSKVHHPALSKLYDAYSFHVIPRIGAAVAGTKEAYQYLVESIRRFPDQEGFADMLRDAGFIQTGYENLSFGVVAIHRGYKA